MKYIARITCEICPAQIEGTVNGVVVYFRSRHGFWQFGAGATIGEAVSVSMGNTEGFLRTGKHRGYMKDAKALMPLFKRCCKEYALSVQVSPCS